MITVQSRLGHSSITAQVTAGCDHFGHRELTVSSHGGQFFSHGHRQGNDKTYADILNRIRTGNVTDADCNQLEERVRNINHHYIPSDAMHVTHLY